MAPQAGEWWGTCHGCSLDQVPNSHGFCRRFPLGMGKAEPDVGCGKRKTRQKPFCRYSKGKMPALFGGSLPFPKTSCFFACFLALDKSVILILLQQRNSCQWLLPNCNSTVFFGKRIEKSCKKSRVKNCKRVENIGKMLKTLWRWFKKAVIKGFFIKIAKGFCPHWISFTITSRVTHEICSSPLHILDKAGSTAL